MLHIEKIKELYLIPVILYLAQNHVKKYSIMNHHTTIDRSPNRFALENEHGQEMGYLDYHVDSVHYFLDYVYVNPAFRGQSVGQNIVRAALGFAQSQHLKAVPICGYAQTVMQRMANRA